MDDAGLFLALVAVVVVVAVILRSLLGENELADLSWFGVGVLMVTILLGGYISMAVIVELLE